MTDAMPSVGPRPAVDAVDRRLIKATQGGLPLCARPYESIAKGMGLSEADVIRRLGRMLTNGVIRRIGAVPNHYRLGYRANGMSVWDVPDDRVSELGARVGALDFVSHSYHRPRHLPLWPYNLFAMVHGRDRDDVKEKLIEMGQVLKPYHQGHEVLFSSAVLKKTGMRLNL